MSLRNDILFLDVKTYMELGPSKNAGEKHVVEIGWVVCDSALMEKTRGYELVSPAGYTFKPSRKNVYSNTKGDPFKEWHGLTREGLWEKGDEIETVLVVFFKVLLDGWKKGLTVVAFDVGEALASLESELERRLDLGSSYRNRKDLKDNTEILRHGLGWVKGILSKDFYSSFGSSWMSLREIAYGRRTYWSTLYNEYFDVVRGDGAEFQDSEKDALRCREVYMGLGGGGEGGQPIGLGGGGGGGLGGGGGGGAVAAYLLHGKIGDFLTCGVNTNKLV